MTLDTRMYVLDKIDPKLVFAKANQILGAHEGIRFTDEAEQYGRPGDWRIGNRAGQGLPALMDVQYRRDGAYRPAPSHDEDCDPDCEYAPHTLAYWLEISFDTPYGYRGDSGEGCGDLHALIVAQMGKWLDERGVRWRWQNEFTGEVHEGYGRLSDLGSNGRQASQWFRSTVLPVIAGRAS